jgi:hypothetical protein
MYLNGVLTGHDILEDEVAFLTYCQTKILSFNFTYVHALNECHTSFLLGA